MWDMGKLWNSTKYIIFIQNFQIEHQAHGAKTNDPVMNCENDEELILKPGQSLSQSNIRHETELAFFKVIEIRWPVSVLIVLVCRTNFGFLLNKGCQSHFNDQTKHIFSDHDISIIWITVWSKRHLVVTFRDFALI